MLLVLVASAGCEGVIGDQTTDMTQRDGAEEPGASDDLGGAPGSPESLPPVGSECDDLRAAGPVFRMLTRDEYLRTVAAWVPELQVGRFLPTDGAIRDHSLHPSNHGIAMDDQRASGYELAAEVVAEGILGRLRTTEPCASDMDAGCFEEALSPWLRRIFRRPASAAETSALRAVYDIGAEVSGEAGIRAVLETALQAPAFLYHVEVGDPSEPTPLGSALQPHELASRLAFAVSGQAPSDALMNAADAGELANNENIAAWTRELLGAHPEVHVQRMMRWAHVEGMAETPKSREHFEDVSDELMASLEESIRAFFEEVVTGDLPLPSWMRADLELEGELGSRFASPEARLGPLMHPAWLAAHAGPDGNVPTLRGKSIAEELLCLPIKPPPAGVEVPPLPEGESEITTRERFEAHGLLACARACHDLMDPPGYAFEHYDALGQWRDDESGLPIDASARLEARDEVEGYEEAFVFEGASELVGQLAESPRVTDCVGRGLTEAALARPLAESDRCAAAEVRDAFVEGEGRYEALLVAVTTSPAFQSVERCQ